MRIPALASTLVFVTHTRARRLDPQLASSADWGISELKDILKKLESRK